MSVVLSPPGQEVSQADRQRVRLFEERASYMFHLIEQGLAPRQRKFWKSPLDTVLLPSLRTLLPSWQQQHAASHLTDPSIRYRTAVDAKLGTWSWIGCARMRRSAP